MAAGEAPIKQAVKWMDERLHDNPGADRVKLVFWDGTGVCLFAKRLEDGQFCWPKIEDGVMRLSAAQLSALLEGLDWKRVRAAKGTLAPRLSG